MKILLALCIAVAVLCGGCRTDHPPKLSLICTLDGFGGGNCVQSDGTREYREPSKMVNFWATTQEDQANFSAWCYGVSPKAAKRVMAKIYRRINSGPSLNPNHGIEMFQTEQELGEAGQLEAHVRLLTEGTEPTPES